MRGEFVDLGGSRLYYYAAGTRGVGEPVIFAHGFPASSHLWHEVVRHMPAGHRLVVVDQLGFGRSDRAPATPRGVLSVEAHAVRLCALMDDLRIDRACVVGHAMGGAVAQSLALAAPERVSRLCLVNSVAFASWPHRSARLARLAARLPSLGRALGAPLLAGLVHSSMLAGFEDRERGGHALDQYLHAFTARLGVDTLIAQLNAMRDDAAATIGERLGSLRLPTAVVWGGRDTFLPPSLGERLRAAIPGATLEVIAEARHFSPEDAPERVAACISALLQR